jgi:hypothetical protein
MVSVIEHQMQLDIAEENWHVINEIDKLGKFSKQKIIDFSFSSL